MPEVWDDGTGRPPRDSQQIALDETWEALQTHDIVLLDCPCGVGKSYMSMALMLKFGVGVYTAPSNELVLQFAEQYGAQHIFGRRVHRDTTDSHGKRVDRVVSGGRYCTNLVKWAWMSAKAGMEAGVVILDEGDAGLASLVGCRGEYKFPAWEGPMTLTLTLALERLVALKDERHSDYYRLKGLFEDAVEFPQYYCIESGKIKAICLRPFMLDYIKPTAAVKVVIMSATVRDKQNEAAFKLLGYRIKTVHAPAVAHKMRRQIFFRPNMKAFSDRFNNDIYVDDIVKYRRMFPKFNMLVHTTYAMQEDLKKHFPDAHYNNHDAKSKDAISKIFQANPDSGLLWISAGCTTGLDLKDGACRVQLILRVVFSNFGDSTVERSVRDPWLGRAWYLDNACAKMVQASGRIVRHKHDWGFTIVTDPKFALLVNSEGLKHLPPWIVESITDARIEEWLPINWRRFAGQKDLSSVFSRE